MRRRHRRIVSLSGLSNVVLCRVVGSDFVVWLGRVGKRLTQRGLGGRPKLPQSPHRPPAKGVSECLVAGSAVGAQGGWEKRLFGVVYLGWSIWSCLRRVEALAQLFSELFIWSSLPGGDYIGMVCLELSISSWSIRSCQVV